MKIERDGRKLSVSEADGSVGCSEFAIEVTDRWLEVEMNNGERGCDEKALYMSIPAEDAPDVLTAIQDWIGSLTPATGA